MAEDEFTSQRLRQKLEKVLGEPEAAIMMDRFATRQDVRVVGAEVEATKHQVEFLRQEMATRYEHLRAEMHKSGRNQLLGLATIVALMNTALAAFSFFQ